MYVKIIKKIWIEIVEYVNMWGYMKCDMCTFRVDIDMKKIYIWNFIRNFIRKFYMKFYMKFDMKFYKKIL